MDEGEWLDDRGLQRHLPHDHARDVDRVGDRIGVRRGAEQRRRIDRIRRRGEIGDIDVEGREAGAAAVLRGRAGRDAGAGRDLAQGRGDIGHRRAGLQDQIGGLDHRAVGQAHGGGQDARRRGDEVLEHDLATAGEGDHQGVALERNRGAFHAGEVEAAGLAGFALDHHPLARRRRVEEDIRLALGDRDFEPLCRTGGGGVCCRLCQLGALVLA